MHEGKDVLKLNQFREVVAIAERGSIRAAARALDVGQPALTRSLAELERELGLSLFERRARGVVATPLGQSFISRATSILHEVRRAREELAQLGGATTGTVTVGLSIAAHLALLPAALPLFTRRYPDTMLHIIEGFYPTLEIGLREGVVDFYLGVDPGRRVAPELSREIVSPNRRTVLCRTGHPLAGVTTLAGLSGARWATTSITADAGDELGAIFAGHGLPAPRLGLRSQSALTMMTCVANSDLLAMVPVQWQHSPLTSGVLATITVREELAALPLVLVRRADILPTPAASHLADLLRRGQVLPLNDQGASQPARGGPVGQKRRIVPRS